jgi:PIN domain nuclease of toxin-antitoxin system
MILLDTHAFLWFSAAPEKLSSRARAAIDEADAVGVCAITCWEIAMLVVRGRLELDRGVRAWLAHALDQPDVELVPLTPTIAVRAAQLQAVHGDPADRMVLASALELHVDLVTKDRRLRRSKEVTTVW